MIKLRSSFCPGVLKLGAPVPDWEMVEGPGCTLNGEKIRARVRPGQAVTDVRGSALQSLGSRGLAQTASGAALSLQVSRSYYLLWGKWNKDPVRFPRYKVSSLCPGPGSLDLVHWTPPFSKFILTLWEGLVNSSAPAQWRTVQG